LTSWGIDRRCSDMHCEAMDIIYNCRSRTVRIEGSTSPLNHVIRLVFVVELTQILFSKISSRLNLWSQRFERLKFMFSQPYLRGHLSRDYPNQQVVRIIRTNAPRQTNTSKDVPILGSSMHTLSLTQPRSTKTLLGKDRA
jgi:hypothetical protein